MNADVHHVHLTTMTMNTTTKPLKKDRECAECANLFDCKGKPEGVKRCLNFKEVKKDGRG
jgi:hypothetical protein